MIEYFIQKLCKFGAGMDDLAADAIKIFAKRDRSIAVSPATTDASLVHQLVQEILALSKLLSHFIINNEKYATPGLRWACYKMGHLACNAASIAKSMRENNWAEYGKHEAKISTILLVLRAFDGPSMTDFVHNSGSNLLRAHERSLLKSQPIHKALYADQDKDEAAKFFQKSDEAKLFKTLSSLWVEPFSRWVQPEPPESCNAQIRPPIHAEDIVMIALYSEVFDRTQSAAIQIIDMIKVISLYYHSAEYFVREGDLLRAHFYALVKTCDINKMLKEHDSGGHNSNIVSPEVYQALCLKALHHVSQCIVSSTYQGPNANILRRVSEHLLNAVSELHALVQFKPDMGSHDERVTVMNELFRAVEDFVRPDYLELHAIPSILTSVRSSLSSAQAEALPTLRLT